MLTLLSLLTGDVWKSPPILLRSRSRRRCSSSLLVRSSQPRSLILSSHALTKPFFWYLSSFRITCSIENGFLLPTSLFSLEPSNSSFRAIPRTNGYGDISAFFTNDQKPPVPVHFVSSRIPSLPEETRACFVGRRFFFDLDASQHRQLVHALSSVVSRMGGEVVSQLPLCDWVVTSKRSGAAYLYVSPCLPFSEVRVRS